MNDFFQARSSAAVLILEKNPDTPDAQILLMERSATVKTHRSQVAFPGGGMEEQDQNDPVKTAVRECFEEVGVDPGLVKVIKTLPPLPTLTSGFFVVPVVARLNPNDADPALKLDLSEVAFSEWVSVEALLNTKRVENGFPVFDWLGSDGKKRKVWGLTAIIFELIFNTAVKTL